jgi:outer membrane receptor protein involved in Fe transport
MKTTSQTNRDWIKRTLLVGSSLLINTAGLDIVLAAESGSGGTTEEVLVTAQRRQESILKVPMSVTSLSALQMDSQGIRQIEDIALYTPDLHFARTSGVSGNNGGNIAIRGIFSDVGSATTAIYIDDTPIQIRSVGYFSGNPYPRVFDLDHVEVLRGPQGTLFGASAMGGAVRFLTAQPNFTRTKIYARSEVATTEDGAPSYEAGAALGTPLTDNIAVETSGWYRRDGGYIDRINPKTGAIVNKDINDQDTYAGRLAFGYRPIEALTITPSIYYQSIEAGGRNQFWQGYGTGTDYKTGINNAEPIYDKFALSGLKIDYDLPIANIVSNTSFFKRDQGQSLDYSNFLTYNRTGNPFGSYANLDYTNASAAQKTEQLVWTEELRVQSPNTSSFFSWLAGIYYSNAVQKFQNLSESGRIPGVISSGFPQYGGRYNLFENLQATDEQFAGFASFDLRPTDKLKLTAGIRVSQTNYDFFDTRDGPTNSGKRTTVSGTQKATPATPRFVATYDVAPDALVYLSASQGFRPGGAQSPVDPNFCAADLATLGLTSSPTSFDSDSLWSYEAGSKNKLLGGRLTVDANLFLIKWDNIQQSIRLPRCSFAYVSNLGSATGMGGDVSITYQLSENFSLGVNVGYAQNKYDQSINGGNGLLLKAKGDYIGGPNWSGTLFGEYNQTVRAGLEGYGRLDYSYSGKENTPDPLAFGYDAGLTPLPKIQQVSIRSGVRFSSVDLSIFAKNLTNSRDLVSHSHDGTTSALYYVEALRPRTIGLTAQYRY